jgi:hypothetical protein
VFQLEADDEHEQRDPEVGQRGQMRPDVGRAQGTRQVTVRRRRPK